jgi:signal transduction histidine kinase
MSAILTQEKSMQPDRTKDFEHRPDRRLLVGYLHKTSNTLCGIKGYASLIADRENATGKAGFWARKILLEVERMEEIFRSVGDLNRGRRHPDTEVCLSGFVVEAASACADDMGGLDLVLGHFPDGELRLPAADLAMMLKELLLNCAESAGLGSPKVRVEINGVTHPVGRVFLEIQDNGSGMDEKLIAQASNPFITTKEEHLGVGLTRVGTLMDMYGLDWSLESEEGRGTRVLLEVAEAI